MSKIDKKSLKILRLTLPCDATARIQGRLGKYTIDYIGRVLNGTRKNTEIIEAAIEIAQEEKDRNIELRNKITELI